MLVAISPTYIAHHPPITSLVVLPAGATCWPFVGSETDPTRPTRPTRPPTRAGRPDSTADLLRQVDLQLDGIGVRLDPSVEEIQAGRPKGRASRGRRDRGEAVLRGRREGEGRCESAGG